MIVLKQLGFDKCLIVGALYPRFITVWYKFLSLAIDIKKIHNFISKIYYSDLQLSRAPMRSVEV